jgi:hypothetical protein
MDFCAEHIAAIAGSDGGAYLTRREQDRSSASRAAKFCISQLAR